MKKIAIFAVLAALFVLVMPVYAAKGGLSPWLVEFKGKATVQGGDLSSYGVDEADLHWNYKLAEDKTVHGNLAIVERLSDGSSRQFNLPGPDVLPVGDEAARPVLFNCAGGSGDARSVRVEGTDGKGYTVAAHFRDADHDPYPNTVWYWVMDDEGNYVSNTNGRLELGGEFMMVCPE